MSPTILPVPAMLPSQLAGRFGGGGGPISAIGFPKRVTRIGFFVFRTCSKTDRHVALNFEIAISSMPICTMVKDHGQTSDERAATYSPASLVCC